MQEPQKMADGNWIMAGLRIGGQYGETGNLPAVAISKGDDFTKWELVVIAAEATLGNIWGESTVIVEAGRILNISRYGKKALALLSQSEDHGRTWTPTAPSNLPMATSKPYAGILSTGQRYLVCTTTGNTGGARSPLTIAVSKPGETLFSKVFLVRRSLFPEGPGVSAPNADFSYPYAVEHDGHLYIGYTHKSHIANELAIVPVDSPQHRPLKAAVLPLLGPDLKRTAQQQSQRSSAKLGRNKRRNAPGSNPRKRIGKHPAKGCRGICKGRRRGKPIGGPDVRGDQRTHPVCRRPQNDEQQPRGRHDLSHPQPRT